MLQIHFNIRYSTIDGEQLYIGGNIAELGNSDTQNLISLHYIDQLHWGVTIHITPKNIKNAIHYTYYFKGKDGRLVAEHGHKIIPLAYIQHIESHMQIWDYWNSEGDVENVFYTSPFKNILLKKNGDELAAIKPQVHSHAFTVKAPLLGKHEVLGIIGSPVELGGWDESKLQLLTHTGNYYRIDLSLTHIEPPVYYKYVVYNSKQKRIIRYEDGDNRIVPYSSRGEFTLVQDGYARLPHNTWRGTGIAIPVFSLRSKKSFGVGEFNDLKLLVDWGVKTGLKLIQILPVNDTTITYSWKDSYPYASISAFALHPIYMNILALSKGIKGTGVVKKIVQEKQDELNELPQVDYDAVIKQKTTLLKMLFNLDGMAFVEAESYKLFFKANKHWLLPYAAFCFLRDKYATTDARLWEEYATYTPEKIKPLFGAKSPHKESVFFHLFVQYHLHLQLKDAVDYAHSKGIVIKGDIPIGVHRYGCDAWVNSNLLYMDTQAGAPPDHFTPIGQNWGFPTYNWAYMQANGFGWWKQRFEQMSHYFDAFRIDHILGFFRIWSIPTHAVQGIMGRFIPAISVHYIEFAQNDIFFDEYRFCNPYIVDDIVRATFGEAEKYVLDTFLAPDDRGGYYIKPEFNTQRKVEAYFNTLEPTPHNERIKQGLYSLIGNVLLFKQEGSDGLEFHFRIAMEETSSFQRLIPHVQQQLRKMYLNYFFERQDQYWEKEALNKLPALKEATNMLICGEDLGMVPACVPKVMQQLGILSLEIQRMPKDSKQEFFNPWEAKYLSVITPSTHDMSTIRGWWSEDTEVINRFYAHVLHHTGAAPQPIQPWNVRDIVLQHLHSPAMWCVFQLQDILALTNEYGSYPANEDRINDPANPQHYWRYRMPLFLEDLIGKQDLNKQLLEFILQSGR